MDSSPKELEPFARAHKRKIEEQDYLQYVWWGNYGLSAVCFAVDHCLNGQKAKTRYLENPVFADMRTKELTEEEKQKEVDKFFAQENARRINWKRNHKKKQSQ